MGYNFLAAERDQLFLLPPDAREWLPAGHLAWAVLEQVGEMELAPFVAWYRADGQGKKAYHPRLMVGLVMYCYCKGIRSSRAVEMATFDDLGARVICGNLHPDHATVARFVTRHEQAVKGLLVASLAACARQGLVSVDVVAGDGTKVKASASMAAGATAEQLEIEIGELEELLEAEVDAWLAQARAADQAEGNLPGLDGGDDRLGPGGGPGGLAAVAGKLIRRQQAKAKLEDRQAARQAQATAEHQEKVTRLERRAAGHQARAARLEAEAAARVEDYQRRAAARAASGSRKRPDGRVPVPADRHIAVRRARQAAAAAQQALAAAKAAPASAPAPPRPPRANTTDPASRVMPLKKGGYDQLYNAQVLAGRHQVIYAIATHDNPADTAALHPLLAAARASLDAAGISDPIGKALFDAGYASEDNFTTPAEAELYVAVTSEARQTGRLRDGKAPPAGSQCWQAMAAKLAAPEGKALYRQRAAIIEPVFAQLFARLGRNLNYRGEHVSTELHLWAATHNLLKAISGRARQALAIPAVNPAPAS
ncbi:MAG TPA: transposase [Streptosporangiaceae bacterium]|nr:transposase [Streptosporangiaceae bacterium]